MVKHTPVSQIPDSSNTTVHIGYLYQDDNGRYKHRMLIRNRGSEASYRFTFKAPNGVQVEPAANARGTLPANSVTKFQLYGNNGVNRDLITSIRDGFFTSATFTAAADPNDIDITTYLIEPDGGAPDVVKHTPVSQIPDSSNTTVHIGYLYQDDNGRYKHRMLIRNRGSEASYRFTFKAPNGVQVEPAANARGTLPANSVTKFQLYGNNGVNRDLITSIRDGFFTSATFYCSR